METGVVVETEVVVETGVVAEAEEHLAADLGLMTGVAEDHRTEVVGNAEAGAGNEATAGLRAEEAAQTTRYIRRGPRRGSNSQQSIFPTRQQRN